MVGYYYCLAKLGSAPLRDWFSCIGDGALWTITFFPGKHYPNLKLARGVLMAGNDLAQDSQCAVIANACWVV